MPHLRQARARSQHTSNPLRLTARSHAVGPKMDTDRSEALRFPLLHTRSDFWQPAAGTAYRLSRQLYTHLMLAHLSSPRSPEETNLGGEVPQTHESATQGRVLFTAQCVQWGGNGSLVESPHHCYANGWARMTCAPARHKQSTAVAIHHLVTRPILAHVP
jgi:hypothetical protein